MKPLLKIFYEDNHLIVIDKPVLLPTMGVAEGDESLVTRVKDYLRTKYNKLGNIYVGVVSRLDSHVSGVIVLARTSKAAGRLADQFRRRTSGKTYLAIISDHHDFADSGRLEHRLLKNESQHRMIVLPESAANRAGEKRAVLVYRTVGRNQGQRLLEIQLETGRKHQIRVQFAACGCPIIGDRKYNSPLPFAEGIALHSHRLEIEHPTLKKSLAFQSLPPACWKIARFGYDGT